MTQQTSVQPTQQAVQPSKQTIRDLVSSYQSEFAKVLPKHLTPERFVRVALTALTKTPKLAECDKSSFMSAMLTLSQLGLEPDGRLAHLIPFNNRKANRVDCQLIIDYKGLVELAMRSGLIASIHADIVCENDEFEYDIGEIKRHKINLKQPRGSAYAVYALIKMRDGGTKTEVMTMEEVNKIRARSRSGNDGPWASDFNEMAKKTVFRRASKWLSLSPEFRDALDKDDDKIDETSRFEAAKPVFAATVEPLTIPEPTPEPVTEETKTQEVK